jgi:DNA-binding phage protein
MPDKDMIRERGRSLEEDYFRKKDRELIEKMRQATAAEEDRRQMAKKSGLDDPALLQDLKDLGFTPETVSLLPLVPLLRMAWAEGGITAAERDLLVRLARSRGIAEGSGADRQLAAWMTRQPDETMFTRAGRLIRAMLDSRSPETSDLSADDLVEYCERIAAASGGVFGIGRISAEEEKLLSSIAQDLKARHS